MKYTRRACNSTLSWINRLMCNSNSPISSQEPRKLGRGKHALSNSHYQLKTNRGNSGYKQNTGKHLLHAVVAAL